jgi:hypothetical protein
VMYSGRIVRELVGDDISEEAIMRPALGGAEAPGRMLEPVP